MHFYNARRDEAVCEGRSMERIEVVAHQFVTWALLAMAILTFAMRCY
jgi:hypothetical protein